MYKIIISASKVLLTLVLLVTGFSMSWAVDRIVEVKVMKAPSSPVIDGNTLEWLEKTSITGYLTPADVGKTLQQWRAMEVPKKEEEADMPKYLIRLEEKKGYGSDHLFKARKDYICKWCGKNIMKDDLYARHTPNKFNENTYPVCRDCAWWLK